MFALVLLFALAPSAQVDVFRVAPGGAGTHSNIQAAIDDATDGDIILVDSSITFTGTPILAFVNGISLTIIGDGPTPPELPSLIVENLPVGGSVVLRNLDIQSSSVEFLTGGMLVVRECEGTVLIEDCLVQGADADQFTTAAPGSAGLFIRNSAGVSVVRSTISGGDGVNTQTIAPFPVFLPGLGGRALSVLNSKVSLHGCTLSGGNGGGDNVFGISGALGGVGINGDNAQLWVVGCTVAGGNGGPGFPDGESAPGARLDGVNGPSTDFRELDSTFAGGTGARNLELLNGTHTVLPGDAIEFSLSAPVRPGDIAFANVDGEPGTLFGVFISAGPGFFPIANFNGVLVTELATFAGPFVITTLPGSGSLQLPFMVPAFGGLEGFLNVDQLISSQPGVGLVVSNATAWVQVENGL